MDASNYSALGWRDGDRVPTDTDQPYAIPAVVIRTSTPARNERRIDDDDDADGGGDGDVELMLMGNVYGPMENSNAYNPSHSHIQPHVASNSNVYLAL